MGKRISEAEVAKRVDAVYALLLRSEARKDILTFALQKWGVHRTTANSYIRKARQLMIEEMESDRREKRAQAVAQRNLLIKEAIKKNKFQTWQLALQDRDTLEGLYFSEADHIEELLKRGYIVSRPTPQSEAGTTDDAIADAKEGDEAIASFFEDDQNIGTPHDPEEGISE